MIPTKSDENAYVYSKHNFLATLKKEQVSIVATIRQPFQNDDDHWLCAANISGLFHRKVDLEGRSAQEAVNNAQLFLLEEFKGFVAEGGQLSMADQSPLSKLEHIFSPQLHNTKIK